MNAPSAPHEPRRARWLFASVPLALLLAALAAWWVPDIGFFEAWPALNVLFFLCGLAVIPLMSSTATLARRLLHITIAAPVAAVFLAMLIGAALDRYYGNDLRQTFYLRFQTTLIAGLSAGLLYAAVAGAIVYLRAQQVTLANRRLASEKQASEVGRQLTETRLRLLQAQIEPHFLFNTLASAQQLAQKGAPDAARLIGQLVRFLRISMPSLRHERAALSREFEQITAYLSIMQTRMGQRLRFTVRAAPDVEDLLLPPALAMTLVENAVKHGIEPSADGGVVEVSAERDGERLIIRVADTGVGLDRALTTTATGATAEAVTDEGGVGLANTRARLHVLFGERAQLELTTHTPRGCIATLTLPRADLVGQGEAR